MLEICCQPSSVILNGGASYQSCFTLDYSAKSTIIDTRGQSHTYVQLAGYVERVRTLLQKHNLSCGTFILVLLDRGPLHLATISALWALCLINVPLDPSVPPQRLCKVQEATCAEVCIHDDLFADVLANGMTQIRIDGSVLDVKTQDMLVGHFAPTRLGNAVTVDCYCIFTSGSTGIPKGVLVSQSNICTYLNGIHSEFVFGVIDIFCCQTSIGFDASINETFLPLILQAGHVSVADSQRLSSSNFVQLLNRFNMSVVQCTPTVWNLILIQLLAHDNVYNCTALSGGEKLTNSLRLDLLKCFTKVLDQYGPTEATVGCANKLYVREASKFSQTRSNGVPLPGDILFCYVDGKVASNGETGELVCCGDKVARYCPTSVNKNSNNFVQIRVSGQVHSAYFTGDLAKIVNSELQVIGRADSQVKINGQRVELEEIESCIEQMCEVCKAICTYTDNLRAYIMFHPGSATLDEGTIVEHIKQSLPSAWIPLQFYSVETIPLTQSKKKDRTYSYSECHAQRLNPTGNGAYSSEHEGNDVHSKSGRENLNPDLKEANLKYLKRFDALTPLNLLGNSIQLAQLVNEMNIRGYELELSHLKLSSIELTKQLKQKSSTSAEHQSGKTFRAMANSAVQNNGNFSGQHVLQFW
eukprot:CAMPEP_0183789924 /NCGR_PEP_ID=MMETSP0803_2-20130417/712_1 /TAXON_ID=195967 /ORGANISM="Crustomastix stigmata, Strain CCMP3273" /LENGTH=640 /DNA_ID=CAMNT_0026034109 /DNA_START=1615 /DNA_END=3534 /DNA_ORIENTATION=-